MILSLLLLFYQANANFYNERYAGYYFFDDFKEKSKSENKKKVFKSAKDYSEFLNKKLEERLHIAIWNPTIENIAKYQKLQLFISNRAEIFSHKWKKSLLINPKLDSTIEYPMSQLGSELYDKNNTDKIKQALKELSKDYGIFFFYKSGCVYCTKMKDIVLNFSKKHGFELLGISLDEEGLADFPDSKLDAGEAHALGLQAVPALYLINPKTNIAIPLSFGLKTQDELDKNSLIINDFLNKGDI